MNTHPRNPFNSAITPMDILERSSEYIQRGSARRSEHAADASPLDRRGYDMQDDVASPNIASGIMLVKNYQIILANSSCAALLGYAPQELMDQDIQNILFPLDGTPITQKIDQAVHNHAKSIHVRAIGIKKTKSILYLNLVCGLSIIDQEPNLIINLLDVTAQTLAKRPMEY